MKKLQTIIFTIISLLITSVVFTQPYQVYNKDVKIDENQNVISSEIIIYIDTPIVQSYNYRDLFILLDSAKEKDTIVLKINTNGGDVYTTLQLMDSIKKCKGRVIAEIINAVSAGAIIAFSCDEIRVAKYGIMMVHNMNISMIGPLTHVESRIEYIKKLNAEVIRDLYKDFLTPQELYDIINNGKQFYLTSSEIVKRLKNMRKKND